eukprot:TRINITY_DN62473_c0_g1_i1.p1 TRINITY_DN62473_c0_g1~~TRINITY_DN62473_c0_g1_i1.p1  ORF type:complete len:163 (-),score=12.27 TRINITY_DN62473_c0_g1_i1:414-902(-)
MLGPWSAQLGGSPRARALSGARSVSAWQRDYDTYGWDEKTRSPPTFDKTREFIFMNELRGTTPRKGVRGLADSRQQDKKKQDWVFDTIRHGGYPNVVSSRVLPRSRSAHQADRRYREASRDDVRVDSGNEHTNLSRPPPAPREQTYVDRSISAALISPRSRS